MGRSLVALIVVIVVVVAVAGVAAYRLTKTTTSSTSTTSASAPHTATTTTTMTTSTSVPTSTAPVTLNVVTYNGINQVLELAAQEFEQLHPGVTVNVITFPWSDYVDNELTVLRAGSSSYDVITFTPTSSQLFFPYVTPINASYINVSDLLWGQEAFGGVEYVNGSPVIMGVAIQTWVELLAYNATLFNNSTIQAEFKAETGYPLNPWNWTSWSEVVAASRFFVTHNLSRYGFIVDDNPSHGLIDTFPAIFWWFWHSNSTLSCNTTSGLPGYGTMFYGCVPSWWGHPFPPPAFNTTAGLQALEVLAQLVKYEPSPTQVVVDYTMTGTLLTQGRVAGAVAWANDVASLPPNVSSQLLLAPLPGGYGEPGSTFLAVSKFSQHKQLAMEFIAFVVSPRFQEQAFYEQGSLPVSKQAINEILSNSSLPAYEREWMEAVLVAGQNSYATPPTVPETYTALIPYFNQAVYSYLTGQITNPWQALQQAAREWVIALEASPTTETGS